MAIVWALAIWLFGALTKGDPLFFSASMLYVIWIIGIGLLVSLIIRTQVTAALLTMVIVFIPAIGLVVVAGTAVLLFLIIEPAFHVPICSPGLVHRYPQPQSRPGRHACHSHHDAAATPLRRLDTLRSHARN